MEARILWLGKPLLMLPGNDLRAELLARRVVSRIHARASLPYRMGWAEDMEEVTLRYGWPVAWSRVGELADATTTGHEAKPSYRFVPEPRALERPLEAEEDDWMLRDPDAAMRYAPRYARSKSGFGPVPHQVATFRRGDSALVVAVYDLRGDPVFSGMEKQVGVVLAPSPTAPPTVRVAENAPVRGVMMVRVPFERTLFALEAWSVAGSRAARVRYPLSPVARDGGISDLLLLAHAPDTTVVQGEQLFSSALGSRRIDIGSTVWLYWETYLPAAPDAPLPVAISLSRADVGVLRRVAEQVHLARAVHPVTVRWTDPGTPGGHPGRTVAFSIPDDVPPGRYRLTMTTGGVDTPLATTSIHIDIDRPSPRR
jgi:hypothetical protein